MREEYDCESIISTYSTLDNHPSVIKEKGSAGYKPYKSRHSKLAEAEAAIAAAGAGAFMKLGTDQAGSESSALSGYSVKGYLAGVPLQGAADGGGRAPTKMIVLKGKLGLPEGYGPVHHRRRQGADDSSTVSSGGAGAGAAPSAAMSTLALSSAPSSSSSAAGWAGRGAGRGKKFRGTLLAGVKEEGDGDSDGDGGCAAEGRVDAGSGDDEEDDDDSDGSDDDEGTITSTASTARLRGETPEQRKARKALVKEEKRAKRATKKQLKLAYKDEFCRQILISGRQQSLNNTSVFKYSV